MLPVTVTSSPATKYDIKIDRKSLELILKPATFPEDLHMPLIFNDLNPEECRSQNEVGARNIRRASSSSEIDF